MIDSQDEEEGRSFHADICDFTFLNFCPFDHSEMKKGISLAGLAEDLLLKTQPSLVQFSFLSSIWLAKISIEPPNI